MAQTTLRKSAANMTASNNPLEKLRVPKGFEQTRTIFKSMENATDWLGMDKVWSNRNWRPVKTNLGFEQYLEQHECHKTPTRSHHYKSKWERVPQKKTENPQNCLSHCKKYDTATLKPKLL